MATFEKDINMLMDDEGGFANNLYDPGGATNFGLSSRFLEDHPELGLTNNGKVDMVALKNLTKEQAELIYKKYYWDKYGYDRISSDRIASKLLDEAVNIGQKTAVRIIQGAISTIIYPTRFSNDGVLGPITINYLNKLDENKILEIFRLTLSSYYKEIIHKNPQLARFCETWERRAEE